MRFLLLAAFLSALYAAPADARRSSGNYYYADGGRCHCRNFSGNGRTDPILRYIRRDRSRVPRF